MRKVTLVVLTVVLAVAFANAQELTNKKGFTLLPEAGDIALGFDAVPFFDFMLNTANIMNNTGQTSQHPGFVSGFSSVIVGKYFLEDDMAVRAKIGINTGSFKLTEYFDNPVDVVANPTDPDTWTEVADVTVSSTSEFIIGGGLEFRRGHNRLQGFYGGELLLAVENGSSKITYAVEQNQDAFDNAYWNADGSAVSDPRVLKSKSSSDFAFGLRGFVGVEYFFAPKIAVAAEFGWGLGYMSSGRSFLEVQSWDAVDNVSETETFDGPDKTSMFGFGVDDGTSSVLAPSAALTLLFHF